MNSVGHMVRSGKLAGAMKAFEETMAVPQEEWRTPSLDTMDKALIYAMRTIANASEPVSGRATELLTLRETGKVSSAPKCPVELPLDLANKDYCEYLGYYHTDFTLPSEYFTPDVHRPSDIQPRRLDFSYLFDDQLSNPDFINMGIGRQVRSDSTGVPTKALTLIDRILKRGRAAGKIVTGE